MGGGGRAALLSAISGGPRLKKTTGPKSAEQKAKEREDEARRNPQAAATGPVPSLVSVGVGGCQWCCRWWWWCQWVLVVEVVEVASWPSCDLPACRGRDCLQV